MSIKVAIIGLGIMGTRMLTHMRLHEKFKPNYLWDPNPKACENALKLDTQCSIMKSADEAIENADLVYLACPPTVRESYAMKVVEMGKALFLEKPFGINIQESKNFIDKLKKFDVPIAVNFTQAGGAPLSNLLESKDKGEMGEMLGADIIVTYSKWPREWTDSVKMALIARDLMVGNDQLAKAGYGEQAQGHYAIAAGFQGQRQWTDHFPNGDFMEAILNTSFDWNGKRPPYIVATENDALNGAGMLFGQLLTNSAQIFADLRTYWSPDAVARVSDGYQLEGAASDGLLHLINSGPAALDGTGDQKDAGGNPTMKPFWEITDEEMDASLKNTTWHPSITEYFPGGGMSTRFKTKGGMKATMIRLNLALTSNAPLNMYGNPIKLLTWLG